MPTVEHGAEGWWKFNFLVMKKVVLYFTALIFVFLVSCEKESQNFSSETEQVNSVPEFSVSGGTTIIFGTRSKPCGSNNGCYCEGNKGLCLLINPKPLEPTGSINLNEGQGIGTWKVNSQFDALEIEITDDFESNNDDTFVVLSNFELPSDVTEALGVTSIILQEGEYEVDYSSLENGKIIVNAIISE